MPLYRFATFEFDSDAGKLRRRGVRLKLQRKPQILLAALVQRPGEVVSRKELYTLLWPEGVFVDFDQGLSVAVKKLRTALGDSSDRPDFIETVAGAGYRFIASVKVDPGVPEPASPQYETARDSTATLSTERALSAWLPASSSRRKLVWSLPVLVICCALLFVFARSVPVQHSAVTRSLIASPTGWEFKTTGDAAGPLVLSPDGKHVVFTAQSQKSGSMLFMRGLDSLSAEALPGTEGSSFPFWSPDSSSIGFFANAKLKTANLYTRAVKVVCAVSPSPRGGTWGRDGSILFADGTRSPILRVSAEGGKPVPVTKLEDSPFTTHRWPEFLSDGIHFIYVAATHEATNGPRPTIFLSSVDGSTPIALFESDSNVLPVGNRLLFVAGGKLLAQSFNPTEGYVESKARVLSDSVEYDPSIWHASFTANREMLIYRPRGSTPDSEVIAWFDESGNMIKPASQPGTYRTVSISPDGVTLAADCGDPDVNICLVHKDSTVTRISDGSIDYNPIWSPDGTAVTYGTHRGASQYSMVLKDTLGNSPEKTLLQCPFGCSAVSWTGDGRQLLIARARDSSHQELEIFDFASGVSRPFLSTPFNIPDARLSPDGKWVAYQVEESGENRIYITSFPVPHGKYPVSSTEGKWPRWSRDSTALYFLDSTDQMMKSIVEARGSVLHISSPKALFRPPVPAPPFDYASFDVSPKQPMFVINTAASRNSSEYVLVTEWEE
jgi:DNA-binding winged helix-turn-helix (wHTH) protein